MLSACSSGDRLNEKLYASEADFDGNIAIGDLGTAYTLTLNGVPVGGGTGMIPLTSGHLYVGNALNVATDVAASGDLTVDNTGKFTVTGLNGVALPVYATGYLYYDSGTGLLSWAAGGGGGVTSVTATAPILSSGGGTPDISLDYDTSTLDVSGGKLTVKSGVYLPVAGNAASATYASNVTITNDATNATMYPVWVTANTGNIPLYVTSGDLTYNPSTGALSATTFVGNLTGNVTGNADTVTGLNVTAGKTLTVTENATISGTPIANPMTTLGDLIYGGALGAVTRLAGDTTDARTFLTSLSVGGTATAPVWSTLTNADVGLGNVENTALSTWSGSANIVTVGTIGTGKWQGDVVAANYGGTGVANNVASTITITGAHPLGLTLTADTSVTLPTTGTLATLAGTEELDNKTLDSSVAKGTWTASGTWTLPSFVTADASTIEIGAAGVIKSGATNADTLLIAANDTTFITLTTGATDTMDIASSATLGGKYIYRADGTDVPVADGGTGLSTIASGSILAANALDTLSAITWDAAGTKVLTNTSGTISWEAAASSGATTALDNLAAVAINTSLVSDTDITDDLGTGDIRWKDIYSATLNAGLTATDTLKLRGRDVDGAGWIDILTITSANTVTADLYTSTTIGGQYVYRAGGTDIPPADGGTGVSNGANNTITFTGNYSLGLTLSNNTSVTLPTTGTLSTLAGAETLTNKTLTTPVIVSFYQDAGKTQLMTVPNTASDTLCAIAATQTLTNKTLTTPVIASMYQDAGKTKLMTLPDTASDTLCALAATQTLTNKTLTTPIVQVSLTAGEAIAQYDACYVKSDGKVYKAKADDPSTMKSMLIAQAAVNNAATGNFMCYGYITNGAWAFTPGATLYVSEVTAGLVTSTAPSNSGDQVQVVGVAITATQICWCPAAIVFELE